MKTSWTAAALMAACNSPLPCAIEAREATYAEVKAIADGWAAAKSAAYEAYDAARAYYLPVENGFYSIASWAEWTIPNVATALAAYEAISEDGRGYWAEALALRLADATGRGWKPQTSWDW